ncbi:MAG: hypothetical protein M3O61_00015 [Gemmatimonadota bacterium]|nr:hypothetical protein [Gemmatimonadota bacterium]
MTKINAVHLLGSGLLAGTVINLSGAVAWEAILGYPALRQLELELPGRTIPMSIGWGLLMGIIAVWLYVSLRAKYGAGARTAALTGGVAWILGHALPSYAIWAFGILSGWYVVGASAIAMTQILLATLAGAALYDFAGDSVAVEKGSDLAVVEKG